MKMDQIKQLWREHEAAPFPPGCRGKEIEGEDLVLPDSYTAGCVSKFCGRRGLDKKRHECLIGCRDSLAKVVPLLGGRRAYYQRLLTLSDLVLAEMKPDRT